MGPFRNTSVSVRLEEEAYLRRHSLRIGVPTSAIVRPVVHRWLQVQADQEEEAVPAREGPERR